MKVIIPLAGYGKRLRPHTHSQPKPLVEVAGKAVLGHIMEQLAAVAVEEIIFIVSDRSVQIDEYMQAHYPRYATRYVTQSEMLGQSHGIYMARPYIEQGDILIIFSDTVFKTDLASLPAVTADGVLHLQEVADPARFGVAIVEPDGFVSRLVEKPTVPVSKLAVVGVYYFKQANRLFEAIENQMNSGLSLNGEYFLADAITLLLQGGTRFQARNLELWEDCGTIPALLEANRHLLAQHYPLQSPLYSSLPLTNPAQSLPATLSNPVASNPVLIGPGEVDEFQAGNYDRAGADFGANKDARDKAKTGYLVIPPVFVAPDAHIERSVIGPFVSVGSGVRIVDAVVQDSIVQANSHIEAVVVSGSVIGRNALVQGSFQRLNIGDDCQLDTSISSTTASGSASG